jgi:hypothetical protein
MAANLDRSFAVDKNGIMIDNDLDDIETAIVNGSIDPSVSGQAAPLGSLFLRSTGVTYVKDGALDTDWTLFASSTGLQDPGANGIVIRTSLNTTIAREIVAGTCGRIEVTDGDGIAGNPTVDVCEMKFGNILAFAAAHG